jgi:predicted ATPase
MSSVAVSFQGRGTELEFLLDRLSAALIGQGTTVAIAGEAGIGKTRLLEEFRKIGDQVDCMMLTGRCIAGPPSPYLPFRDMLPRHLLVESYWGRPDGPGDADRFPFQMLSLVREISRDRTLVLILEDMHWADEESISLLQFLSKKTRGLRVMLVATYRPKEIISSGTDRPHPLYAALTDMRKECLCEEMVIGPLGKAELGRISEDILKGPFEEASINRLLSSTGSNTLYFIETLVSMAEGGSIRQENGVWGIGPGTAVPVNDPVRQAVLGQLDTLTRTERRLLELASVMGVVFEYAVVAEVLGMEATKVSELLDGVETRTELVRDTGKGYRFSDTLTRDVIRGQISPMRQKEFLKAVDRLLGKA